MTKIEDNALGIADNATLTRFIHDANQRLVVIAPALRHAVAEAVAERWQRSGLRTSW